MASVASIISDAPAFAGHSAAHEPQPKPWDDALEQIIRDLAQTAVARDQAGGTALRERNLLRDSGLLALSAPVELGGQGASWRDTLDAVRRIAQVDSALAHLFAFHHLHLATIRLFGKPAQWRVWTEESIRRRWFWGNALNPLDRGTQATPDGEHGYFFSGRKSFCSGAADSERLVASAFDEQGRMLIGVVPTERAGITVLDDWDNIGQRQTDSGTVVFERVRVAHDELLTDPGPLSSPFACLRPLLAQSIFVHIYLGLGEGALRAARQFTLASTRPWVASSAAHPREDPYVLAHYGEFWVALQGALALATQAASAFDAAWARGPALSEAERGQVAIAVATAKVASTRAGLEVAQRIFDVTGARATSAALRLDRYWRNLRVHTLHDPLDYKVRELGDWALNERIPTPSFYS